MKLKVSGGIIAIIAIIGSVITIINSGCTRIEQDELAFKYSVQAGKPVSSQENPLLPFGWCFTWGMHTKVFRVSSQSNQFTFCESIIAESPYDEAVTFDSAEGTTIKVDFTITARVSDVWKFYENYGINQYEVPKEAKTISDPRLYEAIREAGAYVTVILPEITQNMQAAQIRQSASWFNSELARLAAAYMEQFGLKAEQVLLSGNFKYPSGQAVQEATNRLGDKNSEVEQKQREKETAEGRKQQSIAKAQIEADKIIGEAQLEAERLITEGEAIAQEMSSSVKQIGRDKTVDLFISREIAELVRQGKVTESFISEKSLTGEQNK